MSGRSKEIAKLNVLRGLTRRNWGSEVLAGVTLVAIAVPLNIGYAQVAGLPATAGLYALVIPLALFALFASSRQLVASPDAAAAALISSTLTGLAMTGTSHYSDLAMAQALIGGVVFLIASIFKLGFLANFLSEPILIGFVGGLALEILISQVAKMLGINLVSGEGFFAHTAHLFSSFDEVNYWSAALSVGSVLVLILGRRLFAKLPWALVVLVIATLLFAWLGLSEQGVGSLGKVQEGLPEFHMPLLSWTEWVLLIPSSLALVLVTMAEGLMLARKYAEKNGYAIDPNRDLLAFGVANAAAGVSGSFTVGSSASRSAAMDQSGSRTQLPSLVAAFLSLMLLVFGTALLQDIPSPAIGAVVAVAVFPLLGIRELIELWGVRRSEFLVAIACFLASLLLGPIIGVLIAFVLSLVIFAMRASQPAFTVLQLDEQFQRARMSSESLTAPGVIVVRFSSSLFFANAPYFKRALQETIAEAMPMGLRHVVLDCEAITDIDFTAQKTLNNVIQWAERQGISFHFSRAHSGFEQLLAQRGFLASATCFPTNRAAVESLVVPGS